MHIRIRHTATGDYTTHTVGKDSMTKAVLTVVDFTIGVTYKAAHKAIKFALETGNPTQLREYTIDVIA